MIIIDDHNWNRKKVRFCVQKIEDVSVLYYREKETGDSKRPSLRVVAVEDLWETLMGVHEQVCHGGKTRMEKYLVEHGSHVLRPVIQLFLDLCQICQATRGRKRTQKLCTSLSSQTRLGNNDRQTWLICRWYRITVTSSSSTTRTVSASTSSFGHSRPS